MKLSNVLLGTLLLSTTAVAANNQTCTSETPTTTVCQLSIVDVESTQDKGDRQARKIRRKNKRRARKHRRRFAGSCGLG